MSESRYGAYAGLAPGPHTLTGACGNSCACGNALCRDEDANDWLVFVPQLPKDFGDALFVVNHRRYTRRDDGAPTSRAPDRPDARAEEAFTVVDVLDGTLIEALRCAPLSSVLVPHANARRDVCNNVENIFATKPSLNLRTIYPYIDALAARAAELAAHDKAASAALESFLQVVADEFAPQCVTYSPRSALTDLSSRAAARSSGASSQRARSHSSSFGPSSSRAAGSECRTRIRAIRAIWYAASHTARLAAYADCPRLALSLTTHAR